MMLDKVLKTLMLIRDGVPPRELDMGLCIDIIVLELKRQGRDDLVERALDDLRSYRPTAVRFY